MTRSRLRTALAALTVLGVTACGAFGGTRSAGAEDTVRVHVDNQNFADATIYVRFEGGAPMRLGQVVGKTQDVFSFPYRNAPVRLEIRLLAGGTHITDEIQVYRGDELDLVIPAHLDQTVIR